MCEGNEGIPHYQTKEPGKSDFYFLNTVKEGGNGPLVRKLGVVSKCPVGIREALGAVVGIFLQSFLDIRPELERESTSRLEEPWFSPRIPANAKTNPQDVLPCQPCWQAQCDC